MTWSAKPKFLLPGPIRAAHVFYEIAGVLHGMLFVVTLPEAQPSQPFSGKLFCAPAPDHGLRSGWVVPRR